MSTNGAGDLAGWVIALIGGSTFIGREVTPYALAPVYALNVNIRATDKGVVVNYVATPVLMLASLAELELPQSAVIIGCERLTHAERKRLHSAVRTAEENVQHMRAADAGLLLANKMPVAK